MTPSPDPAIIERAAEAICALHEDLTRTPWSEWADIVKDCYRADARAALRAAESPAPTDAAAQKESFVRGEMGMAAADRAQTKLKRPRTKDNANV
jgi:hypothetical protein